MSKESIENITKSECFWAPHFVNHYILPDKNFNGHCLINNNISMSKKVINLYILLTYFIVKRFKHRFYIK